MVGHLPALTSTTHPPSQPQGEPLCESTGLPGRTRKVVDTQVKPELFALRAQKVHSCLCRSLVSSAAGLMTSRVKRGVPVPVSAPPPCRV